MYKGNHYCAVCERVTHELNATRAVAVLVNTAQKMKFFFKDFLSKCNQIRTEEILNGKPHFLCSEIQTINGKRNRKSKTEQFWCG